MALKVVSMNELKLDVLLEPERTGDSVAEVCRRRGIARASFYRYRCYRYRRRYLEQGEAGLEPRSRKPKTSPGRIAPALEARIVELRKRHPRWGARRIHAELAVAAVVSILAVLKRIGLGKRSRLEPLEPAHRYECSRPGELLHVDVKKLGRFTRPGHRMLGRGRGRFEEGAGYEFVHVCVDDFSRLAYVEVLPDERALTAIGFLRRAVAWFAAQGVTAERVMTDNGPAYRSHAHQAACALLGLRHSRTKPRRPRTNGKAERFIQTLLTGWAYARLYASSRERAQALPLWLNHYGCKSSRWTGGGSFARVRLGAGDRELKRRRWGCLLPRCLAA